MEDVLEVYHRSYGDNEVLVCLDETSKQQVSETRQPRPSRPGAAQTYDYEYQRKGVSNLFKSLRLALQSDCAAVDPRRPEGCSG